MSSVDLCRLCVSRCQKSKTLFDENGQQNDAYHLMAKYFDTSYFNVELVKKLTVICFQCWQHIDDFNTFQQSVLKAQQKLLQTDQEEIKVKIKSEPELQHEVVRERSPTYIKLEISDDTGSKRVDVIIPDAYNSTLVEEYSQSEMEDSEDNSSSDEASESETTKSHSRDEPSSSNLSTKLKEQERIKESDATIARWKPFLACFMCSEPCATLTILQHHFRQEHPGLNCYVLCCSRRLNDRSKIERHMKYHINPKSFKCETCGERFGSGNHLGGHKIKYHLGQNRGTALPIRKSTQKSDEFIAKWYPNLECPTCNVKLPTYSRLQEHFSDEHPLDMPYISCCGRKCSGRNRVEEHVQLHMDPEAFKCEKCDKCFKMRWHLIVHIRRVHTDKTKRAAKKPLFSKMGSQQDEIIAQWKPMLECIVCKESYPKFTLLVKHFRAAHPNQELYIKCCLLKLNRPFRIMEHARYHADPEEFTCKECGKLHKFKNSLDMHIRVHHPKKKL